MDILDCPPPLQERNGRGRLKILFKARNDLIDIPTEDFKPSNLRTRGKLNNYHIPSSSVDSHLFSFYPNNTTSCGIICPLTLNLLAVTLPLKPNLLNSTTKNPKYKQLKIFIGKFITHQPYSNEPCDCF